MFCRKCGREIPDDSEFCPKCGEKMITEVLEEQKIEQAKPKDSGLQVCSKCGKPIPKGNMFCPSCGTDIPSVEIVSENAATPKNRSKKGTIIGIVAAAAVAVFAAIFIPIQVHNYKNSFPEFEKHLDSDGRYTIDKYVGDEEDVVIPDIIKGKPVYTINEYAFSGKNIKSVQIGKNTRIIGSGAFMDCLNLETVSFSNEDPQSMGNLVFFDQAFKNCSMLKSVEFPSMGIHIFSEAFYGCKKLSEIRLSDVLSIEDSAFENCSGLSYVQFENIEFTPRCFANCTALSKVSCNGCGNLIAKQAFSGCTNLTSFIVGEKTYSSPSELESAGIAVGAGAFNKCENFKDSESVTHNNPNTPRMTYDTIVNSNGYYEDVCDYVFYDDPSVYGTWETVGFVHVQNLEAWEFGTVMPSGDVSGCMVQNLELLSDGTAKINGIVQAKWTNGFVITTMISTQTVNKFYTVFINGIEYLAIEHKSGDYSTNKVVECYFILTRKSGGSGNNSETVTPTSHKFSDYTMTELSWFSPQKIADSFGSPELTRPGIDYYDGAEVYYYSDGDSLSYLKSSFIKSIVVFGGKEQVVIDDVHLGESIDYYNNRLSFDAYDALEVAYEIQGLGARYDLPVRYTMDGTTYNVTYRFDMDTMIAYAAEVSLVVPMGY